MPERLPDMAVIVATPGPRAVARPCETNATELSDEVQVAVEVRSSRVAPLEDTATAVNCRLLATGMEGLIGVIEIEAIAVSGGLTVRITRFEVMPAKLALMLVVPDATATASPFVPKLLIVTTSI